MHLYRAGLSALLNFLSVSGPSVRLEQFAGTSASEGIYRWRQTVKLDEARCAVTQHCGWWRQRCLDVDDSWRTRHYVGHIYIFCVENFLF